MATLTQKFKNFQKNIGKQIVHCPSCQRSLRVPVKPRKTLEISCPDCPTRFQIRFDSPLAQVFGRQKGVGIKKHLQAMGQNFQSLPTTGKVRVLMFLLVLAMSVDLLLGLLNTESDNMPGTEKQTERELKALPSNSNSPYNI
ncbi:MAG: hypothetical protein HN509_08710 [Halobacteriovoraceae bacterium]|jgi:hypothetical protein|nr:hypothetical protein [Halobacteriovoraceae bacterium]